MTSQRLISLWFKVRFERSPKKDPDYFEEWLGRFDRGTAWDHMDEDSRNLWTAITKNNCRGFLSRDCPGTCPCYSICLETEEIAERV